MSLVTLFKTESYPSHSVLQNLTAAPELLGTLLLTLAALAAERGDSGISPGADELLRRLSADPPGELARRGFLRTGSNGGVQVYSRKR